MKVQFGAIVNDARNKTGGIVFSKNKAGSFVRRKVAPSQPRTPDQLAIRADLTNNSKDWGGVLTQSQRDGWIAFAASNPVRDQFGNSVTLTGEQMYVRLNNTILQAGGTTIADPPANLDVPTVTALVAAAASGAGTFTVNITQSGTPAANPVYQIYATAQLSPGRKSVSSFYRKIMTMPGNTAQPATIFAAYTAKFGSLIAGKTIGVSVSVVDNTTGAQSAKFGVLITVS